jgi:hypothetical protein
MQLAQIDVLRNFLAGKCAAAREGDTCRRGGRGQHICCTKHRDSHENILTGTIRKYGYDVQQMLTRIAQRGLPTLDAETNASVMLQAQTQLAAAEQEEAQRVRVKGRS